MSTSTPGRDNLDAALAYKKERDEARAEIAELDASRGRLRSDLRIRYHVLADALGLPHDDNEVNGYYGAVESVSQLRAEVGRLRRELDRVSAEATLNTIPDDAAERITAKLCHLGVVDPDDDTMPVFMDVEDQEASGGRIDHWVHVDGVAEELLKAVRSWLSTPATDHAPAADPTEYCAGLTWTVRHVPPGTIDPEDTDEPIRAGWWVLGVDPEDPELPVVQVWLGETLPGAAPAPAAPQGVEDTVRLSRSELMAGILVGIGGKDDAVPTQAQLYRAVDLIFRHAQRRDRQLAEAIVRELGRMEAGTPAVPLALAEPIHIEAEAQTSIRHELCTPAEPTTWTEHDVEVLHQDDGWATAQCHTCGASIGESIEDDVEDWVDQHRADTLRPAGEEQ
ncbi:MAG TPA: hypothetical protein VGL02_32195 [Streptomyces sp.]